MQVTRTETYTDWVYRGAHMNETAATVGVGLLRGYIYYRYAHDMLREGDVVMRETSHVHLSDGSTYELGSGLSSEKIDIEYEGKTPDGSVSLKVNGKLGVGVSRITRNLTISFDDGKVPVLDTEQLDEILSDLSGSLSESMKNTADAIKQELLAKVDTVIIDANEHADSSVATAKEALEARILEVAQDTKQGAINSATARDTRLKQELVSSMSARSNFASWRTGRYTLQSNVATNMLFADATSKTGSNVFVYDSDRQSVRVRNVDTSRHMVFRVTLTATFSLADNIKGYIHFQLRNSDDATIHQTCQYIDRNSRMPDNIVTMQVGVELFIAANSASHGLFTSGLRAVVYNNTTGQIIVPDNSILTFSLISM